MEKLEEQIQQQEASFLAIIAGVLSQSGSDRTKISIINKQYIKHLVAIDDLVSAAKLQPAPAGAVRSN